MLLLAVGLVFCESCGAPSEQSSRAEGAQNRETGGRAEARSGESSRWEGDLNELRVDVPESTVLVRSKGKAFITAKEYNTWLGTYPLNLTSQDPVIARMQAVEQMAIFLVVKEKAHETGYISKVSAAGVAPDSRTLVLTFVRDQVTNASVVTEQQVREYQARNPGQSHRGRSEGLPADVELMATKQAIQGERFWKRVQSWMAEAALTYDLPKP